MPVTVRSTKKNRRIAGIRQLFANLSRLTKPSLNGKKNASLNRLNFPKEAGIYGMTLPGSLAIPTNEVFLPQNLARIPQDKTVLVICKSGTRAAAVATALRHIGFNDVYILKGG